MCEESWGEEIIFYCLQGVFSDWLMNVCALVFLTQ